MKIEHKVNGWVSDRTDPAWAERVEREAERTTDATERAHRKAEERLARAIAKARAAEDSQARSMKQAASSRRVKRLWMEVEKRREELLTIQRLANRSPAGAQNRGTGAHRGVSLGETL